MARGSGGSCKKSGCDKGPKRSRGCSAGGAMPPGQAGIQFNPTGKGNVVVERADERPTALGPTSMPGSWIVRDATSMTVAFGQR